MRKTLAITLSLLQILLVFSILSSNMIINAESKLSYDIGCDNSLLMPTYEKAQVGDFTDTPDWLESAIINQIRLETATVEGTISAAEKLLPFYEQLGINCLLVNPINEKGTSVSTPNGYHNNGLHTIDLDLTEAKTYQEGWANFAEFVKKAHAHNIRIMVDVIYWGVDKNAPMATDSKYADVTEGYNEHWGGYSYNYDSEVFCSYYVNTMLDIIDKTQIDGLRVDLAPTPENCSWVFNRIRRGAFEAGNPIVIMSEGFSNDRTGGTDAKVWDLEQVGVFDQVNKDYWSDSWLQSEGLTSADNWQINVYQPASFWLTTAKNRDIVTTTKNGKVYSGTATQQKHSGTLLESLYGSLGKNQYYTYAVSYHDVGRNKNGSVLDYGYSAVFAPVIPFWMAGDEMGSQFGQGIGGALYFNSLVAPDLVSVGSNAEFYKKLKKYIEIRRTYSDIFEYFPENHRNTNICKVSVSGISTYQAYARYANGKGVLIIPNGTDSAVDITVTIPLTDMSVGNNYIVKNLMTDENITASSNKFTVNVKSKDFAVILVDDGSTQTTGCENTVAKNKELNTIKANTTVGMVESKIDLIGDVDINSGLKIDTAYKAYNLLTDAEKVNVKNYYTLKEAKRQYDLINLNGGGTCAGYLTEDNFIPNSKTKTKWGWPDSKITFGQNEDGSYKIKYNEAHTSDYRFEIAKAVNLDGAHLNITLNKGSKYYSNVFYLRISSKHFDNTLSGSIGIKFDCNNNSQIFFTANGSKCDHSSMPGYNSAYPDRIFCSLGSNIDLKFKYEDDGGFIITVNGTDYKIKSSDMHSVGDLLTEDAIFYVTTADNSFPDLDINYLHSGDVKCNKGVIKTGDNIYEVTTDSFTPDFNASDYNSWNNILTKKETDKGLEIEYKSNIYHSEDYRLVTKETYDIDGLHLRFEFNDKTYYSRLILLTLSNDSSTKGNGLKFKIDSKGSQFYAYLGNTGNPLNTSGYVTTNTNYTDRIFDPAINNEIRDILFKKMPDGGLEVNINGYVFPISADNMDKATGLTDLSNAYVGFSSFGSWPDYTINFMHDSNELCYECDLGDVNCDHTIDIRDLVAIKKITINMRDIYSADLNSDSMVNAQDIAQLRKYLLNSF